MGYEWWWRCWVLEFGGFEIFITFAALIILYMYSISEVREWVDRVIRNLHVPGEPQELYGPVSYVMSMGGKRVRPMLCVLSCNLFSERIDNRVLFPAVGLELFHAFTLVHDDIMDNAVLRRNQATVHRKWDVNSAILSGDVMCIAAYRYICEVDPVYLPEVLRLFNETAAQVCEGQQLDMNYERHAVISEEEYLQMVERKTAVLLAAAAKIGAIAGGASSQHVAGMYEFGRLLGVAFQIQDDLLDVYGDADIFGKVIGHDIACNKKTFLLLLAMQQASGSDKRDLFSLLTGKGVSVEEKIRSMLDIYRRLQIRQQVEGHIAGYYERALALLDTVDVAPGRKEYMRQFAEKLVGRKH
ncbi:MAG: polyprenyl synthetase family protein [Prevotellaceae bacterium]|jgi:geranylgeranyl diphosphate synthase type II|nr:polyprenyl synthetase family protein [Prevotellaceae bacterium]